VPIPAKEADEMTTEAMEEAIRNGLTALDFCGSVPNAIREVADDYGIKFTTSELATINRHIQNEWDKSRNAAGVFNR
jgi:hypothetical protein